MEWLSEFAKNPFYELGIILLLAAILGSIGRLLRQPLIVMFVVLGIIAGPSVLDVVHSHDNIHLLADAGIAILLFIVGLKLDLRLIKSIGTVALIAGLGQVIFTAVTGYLLGTILGFSWLHSFYIAVALTFSSTIIIVKMLSDKNEIDSLYGQVSIGILIIQDIIVIAAMIILSSLGDKGGAPVWQQALKTGGLSLLLIAATFVMMKWVIPRLTFYLAKSMELLSLFAIAWAIALAALSEIIGFSSEVGAFLAGVSLASSPFKDAISSRLNSIRDFLLLFFFVNLGANLNFATIGNQVPAAIVFSLFVLLIKPVIVVTIMGRMGYRKRPSFLAGLTLAQISEFSLIFAGLGLQIGHLNEEAVGLITLVGLITIGLSTYLILYSDQIYELMRPALKIFERKRPFQLTTENISDETRFDIVIFGLGRFGSKIAEYLDLHPDVKYLGVDFDPKVVKQWQAEGKSIIYGDIEDPDILEHIPFGQSTCILSTINNSEHSIRLIRTLRKKQYGGRVFLTASNEKDFQTLSKCPADKVLMIHNMAAENFYNSYLTKLLECRTDPACKAE